ncbi:hypothetical protein CERZMDRAFT_35150 [Cercospora zeae-maydis SCOH1-5]|uniref:Major facilitator superfamily (MFS) profile domain-containing protein n=1 Tax=Cercospora zeae-maydis SCOH1-5 TaxID=717836 RepID=A0A6A6FQR9_9PEZI|nr:hypothetical protein CERZMDRAFT_35150 [Cercospora zeae-maydis SCOH1-5]
MSQQVCTSDDAEERQTRHDVDSDALSTRGPGGEQSHTAQHASEEGLSGHQCDDEYSFFTTGEKRLAALCGGLAALMSPMASQIYYPSLNEIARDLHVSNEEVNLTMTMYLIMQGLAPSFVSDLSDNRGRRPTYLACLFLFMGATLGLALQNSYAALMVLRCLQAGGSSSTVVLANAVVADMITSQERGAYVGYMSIPPQAGPTLAPIIGGLLGQFWGWHSVFWFLLVLSSLVFIVTLFFLPETCRNVVGNGSIAPPAVLRCLTNRQVDKRVGERYGAFDVLTAQKEELAARRARMSKMPSPWTTFRIAIERQAGFTLFFITMIYSSYSALIALIPSRFGEVYGFNQIQIGLTYIPFGVGSLLGAVTRGTTIDARFRHHAKRLGVELQNNRDMDLSEFPLERARIEVAVPFVVLASACIMAFGWLLQARVHLAGPLILLFVIGYCVNASINTLLVLLVDIHQKQAGRAMAASNLCRCWGGAGASSAVLPMINAIGMGWTMIVFGLLPIVSGPVLYYIVTKGPEWRRQTREKQMGEKAAAAAAAGSA